MMLINFIQVAPTHHWLYFEDRVTPLLGLPLGTTKYTSYPQHLQGHKSVEIRHITKGTT